MARSKKQRGNTKLNQAKKDTPHFQPSVSLKVLRSLHNAAANGTTDGTSSPLKLQAQQQQHNSPIVENKASVASSLLDRIKYIKKGGAPNKVSEGNAHRSASPPRPAPANKSPQKRGRPTTMPPPIQKEKHAAAAAMKAAPVAAVKKLPSTRKYSLQHRRQQQQQHQQQLRNSPQETLGKAPIAIPLPRSKSASSTAAARPLSSLIRVDEEDDADDRQSIGRQSCTSLQSEELSTPMRVQLSDLRRFVTACQLNPHEQAAVPFGQRTSTSPSSLGQPLLPAQQSEGPSVFSLASLRGGLRTCGTMLAEGAARLSSGNPMNLFSAATHHDSLAPLSVRPAVRSCVVMDTSSLLRADVAVLNLMVEKWTLCVPFAVLDELDNFIHGKKSSNVPKERREQNNAQATIMRNWMSAQMKKKDESIRFQKKSEIVQEYDVQNKNNDDSILGFAVYLREKGHKVLFITDDIILSLKAKAELGDSSTYTYSMLKSLLGLIH